MNTNNSIPEQLVNLLEWFAGCLDMNLSPSDNASKFIKELPDDPKAQSLISSLLHPSPVNEDWKKGFRKEAWNLGITETYAVEELIDFVNENVVNK